MDESEFLQSLKTDEEKFDEHTAGAEHFVRLKRQSGIGQPPVDETEKTAGMARAALHGAKASFRTGARSLQRDLKGVANSRAPNYVRAFDAGSAAAKIAPGVAAGAVAHAVGKHQGKRETEREIFGDLEEKRASMADKLKSIGPLAGTLMAGGAAAGGIGTYLASKPQEDLGGKSRAEDELEAQVKSQQGRPEKGLLHKMKNRTTELEHGYAKAFRDHPGKAALIGAGAGAAGGYGLARLLAAIRGV